MGKQKEYTNKNTSTTMRQKFTMNNSAEYYEICMKAFATEFGFCDSNTDFVIENITHGPHGKNQKRHQWGFQQNQGWGRNVPDIIKNQPWNINAVSSSFNGWMSRGNSNFRDLLGAPPWARGVAGGASLYGVGVATDSLNKGAGCDKECR